MLKMKSEIKGNKDVATHQNNDLQTVSAAKIKLLTAELKGADVNVFNPVERIRDGFARFKKEKYVYAKVIDSMGS
nr:carbonic anhydrase 2 [Tanacetum cinerariifolium]